MSSTNVWKEKGIMLCLYTTWTLTWIVKRSYITLNTMMETKKLLLISLFWNNDHIYTIFCDHDLKKTGILAKHLLLFSIIFLTWWSFNSFYKQFAQINVFKILKLLHPKELFSNYYMNLFYINISSPGKYFEN